MLLFLQVNDTHLFEQLARRNEPSNNLELAEKRSFFNIGYHPNLYRDCKQENMAEGSVRR